MEYRREIDGLRAIAVSSVILFHAGLGSVQGGYVGVDVFFVISGYLITSIIIRDLNRQTWSLLDFYERRARRILPALILVILCCWPVAWLVMLPLEMRDFAQSVAAAALSVSNILFWSESDYFAVSAELKPLLHTWTLGVEEQFYILFPLLLALIWSVPMSRRVLILSVITIVSFASCVVFVHRFPDAVFYLLPFRAWELLAGTLCAFWHAHKARKGNEWLAAAGLAALIVSIFAYDKTTPFPSAYALLPVVGTCCVVLFADASNWTGRFLSLRPLVGIGLISYSAYLWHQPLFAFTRLYSVDHPTTLVMLGLSIASLVLAYFSWRFVELPFRRLGLGALMPNRTVVLSMSVAAIAIGLVAGAAGHVRVGWPSRFTVEQQGFIADNGWSRRCLFTRLDPIGDLPQTECTFAAQGSQKGKVALVGDSVMSSISPELIAFFTENGFAVDQLTHSHCTLHRNHRLMSIDAAACPVFISNAVDYIADNNYDLVVTASNFIGFFKDPPDGLGLIREDGQKAATDESLRADMAATIADLKSPLFLIDPHPNAPVNVVNLGVRQLRTHGRVSPYGIDFEDFVRQRNTAEQMLSEAISEDTVRVDLTPVFCSQTQCQFFSEGVPVLSDTLHFTPHGARVLVRPAIEEAIDVNAFLTASKG